METITNLIKDTPIPKMVKVRQNFDKTCIPESDIPGIITRELDRPEIGGKIQPGQKIAITCGSRGINHNAVMARAIVDFVKSKGAEPYIVAAMGSHGGATAEGQLQILKDYGVTEEAMGCPVKSSMETVQIGISGMRHQPVFMDKNASEADGIILFNRIKPHTSFRGPYESGLMKMMAIGLGKQKGAESIHHQSPAIMHELVEEYGRTILENAPVLGGIAIIENAYDDTYLIKGLSPEEIISEEPKLKEISYKTIAHLLFDKCDVLVVDKIGKNISGDGMEQMQSAARDLAAKLATVPGTENVSDGLEQAAAALHLSVDRNAAMEKGLTVAQVYMAVASALTDTDSSLSLTLDGLDVSVSIQSPEESRMTREKLLDLEIDPSSASAMSSMMSSASSGSSMGSMSSMSGMSGMSSASASGSTQSGKSVRLGDIAQLEETVSLNTINRDQQRRYITVSADVADGYNVTKVTSAAEKVIGQAELPQGITAAFQGENEAIMDAIRQLLLMLLLGIVLVYLVMVAQFQSLRSPLIVMFTIPLAFTGGFLALLLAGVEVSVISLIGFVMLVGVIVNNGIVLVDYINQLRLEGMGRREAIIEAGVTRLRPILMTSLTTILGYSAMSGVIGGGGLGKIALSYGYYRYQTDIMIVCVVLLVLMVQAFQSVGTLWATKSDKRLRK